MTTEHGLRAKGLHCHYDIRGGLLGRSRGRVQAVHGVDLELGVGEALGLVGESGCGKSTLGRALVGLEPIREGHLSIDGYAIDVGKPRSWTAHRQNIQMVFQDPYTSLNPRLTIEETLAEPMLHHGICHRKQSREKVAELLQKVELSPDVMDRFPHAFSGGQRQRICIARALGLKPKYLICDEVVSALDVSVQAQILELLSKLRGEEGLSLLFIAHDLSVVRQLCDRVMVMYLGKVVEEGSIAEVYGEPAHPYTRALLDAIPTLDRTQKPKTLGGERPSPTDRPKGCSFRARCPKADDQCLTEPEFKKVDVLNRGWACHHP